MDWDDIRIFLALARQRRMGAAARSIGQNATTVARRIRRIERQLETSLFESGPAGYTLTEDGETMLRRAEAMETEALDIAQQVGRRGQGLAGSIRLSVSEGFGTRVLAPMLAGFTMLHPDVTIDLVASSGFLNPSRREVDLAIMLSRPLAGPLLVRKLTDYRLGLYASGRMAAQMQVRSADDLIGKPLIGYMPDFIYAPELDYLEEVDPRLRANLRSSSINAQAEMIRSGAGFGILPCFIGDTLPGLERQLPSVEITRTFWLVTHRDLRRVARIDRFVDWLDEAMAAMQPLLSGRAG